MRRKTMFMSLGAVALGWLGLGATRAAAAPQAKRLQDRPSVQERVRPEPRAIPFSDSKL